MTIPIIPGPFAFLAEAGQAVGDWGTAIAQRNELRRKIAEHGATFVQGLVEKGYLSADAFKDPDVQKTLHNAGIPVPKAADILPQPEEQKKRITSGELATVQPGTPQARAVAGVPSPEVAGVTEKATVAQGNQVVAASSADIAKSKTFQAVYEGAKTLLGDDPFAAQLAQEAALGILPHRIAELELRRYTVGLGREAQNDAARLLLEAIGQTGAAYKDLHDKWQQGLDQAILLAGAPTDPKVRQKIIDTYTKDHGPEPDYEKVSDQILSTQYGLTRQQFQQGVQNTLRPVLGPSIGGDTKSVNLGDDQTGQLAKIFYDAAQDPTQLQTTISAFRKHLKDGTVSTLTAQAVVARLKATGAIDDATLKLIMTPDTTTTEPPK